MPSAIEDFKKAVATYPPTNMGPKHPDHEVLLTLAVIELIQIVESQYPNVNDDS